MGQPAAISNCGWPCSGPSSGPSTAGSSGRTSSSPPAALSGIHRAAHACMARLRAAGAFGGVSARSSARPPDCRTTRAATHSGADSGIGISTPSISRVLTTTRSPSCSLVPPPGIPPRRGAFGGTAGPSALRRFFGAPACRPESAARDGSGAKLSPGATSAAREASKMRSIDMEPLNASAPQSPLSPPGAAMAWYSPLRPPRHALMLPSPLSPRPPYAGPPSACTRATP
mmetsp:Transcript_10563/g.35054  ORF Transcript_10563/g.35054 Transcript_10563/m.35054 type:complete len:229 (-) Transcript_10563:243-929(-)